MENEIKILEAALTDEEAIAKATQALAACKSIQIEPPKFECSCNLCIARQLSEKLGRKVDSWEVYFGMGSERQKLVEQNPGQPIYWYEEQARLKQNG